MTALPPITPIRRLLVANRGEIAVRIMRTCRALGIHTIAVYSDADAASQHVMQADEAVRLGPAPAGESYLDQAAVLAAARATGADAIHPGYGFLSENPDFARAAENAGIIFIGPSAEAMDAMALKGAAKHRMEDAGVPVVPGYHGVDQSAATLTAEAARIGYPLLVKAVAGGGGKGMRAVHTPQELDSAIAAARREGESSFGNGDLLLEKLIEKPRHIEVQIMGDRHGRVVHLNERDCSLQRRHQKVIEESPAPGIDPDLRRTMGEAAVKAGAAIGYSGAGTVEFIMDVADGTENAPFYFMEMNTRLQVEHPVTEMVTGEDLVAWQIRVAEGHPLTLDQQAIEARAETGGHAVEARLYAEDPASDFLPATGTLALFDPARPLSPGQRVDAGVRAGDAITIHYDPMIAKLIAHGPDRQAAINGLLALIAASPVAGLTTNRDFLAAALDHPAFRAGDLDTGFIPRHRDALIPQRTITDTDYILAALAVIAARRAREGDHPFAVRDAFWPGRAHTQTLRFLEDGAEHPVHLTHRRDGSLLAACADGTTKAARIEHWDGARLTLVLDGHRRAVFAHITADRVWLVDQARTVALARLRPTSTDLAAMDAPGSVTAPMPGKVLSVHVANGDRVSAGDPLLVMEAMKMEQTLKAPRDGVVDGLSVAPGDQVADGADLLTVLDNDRDNDSD
ncbi:ATP-binding protein [Yunchengibacter salinarum]|uniref:ATP-binding protein n=1 Tax=Yunchengibacter salinarum TaxID=3133399 RepID=UPI0035B5C454